jgi:hypothetical protein
MRNRVMLFVFWMCASIAYSQSGSDASAADLGRIGLQMKTSTAVQFQGPNNGHIGCDRSGNLYARGIHFDDQAQASARAPVEKIAPDGRLVASFRITDASSNLIVPSSAFFVSPTGQVHIVGISPKENLAGSRILVAKFSNDGKLIAKTEIQASEQFDPYQIAVFPSGEFLLSGWQGKAGHRPFAGVFSREGRLISKIHSPEDDELEKRADSGDSKLSLKGSNHGNLAALGGAAIGSDGNAYLMRRTSPAVIYAVSNAGKVLRTLRVDPGDSDLTASDIQSSEGKLAVMFGDAEGNVTDKVLKVEDLVGNSISTYRFAGDGTPAATLGCFNSGVFSFLKWDGASSTRLDQIAIK